MAKQHYDQAAYYASALLVKILKDLELPMLLGTEFFKTGGIDPLLEATSPRRLNTENPPYIQANVKFKVTHRNNLSDFRTKMGKEFNRTCGFDPFSVWKETQFADLINIQIMVANSPTINFLQGTQITRVRQESPSLVPFTTFYTVKTGRDLHLQNVEGMVEQLFGAETEKHKKAMVDTVKQLKPRGEPYTTQHYVDAVQATSWAVKSFASKPKPSPTHKLDKQASEPISANRTNRHSLHVPRLSLTDLSTEKAGTRSSWRLSRNLSPTSKSPGRKSSFATMLSLVKSPRSSGESVTRGMIEDKIIHALNALADPSYQLKMEKAATV